MIKIRQKGDFKNVERYLKIKRNLQSGWFKQFADKGLQLLKDATPVNTGKTAESWYYEITQTKNRITVTYCNSNNQNGVPIAIILQYGHATRNGGWVEGINYINPAIQPFFNEFANKAFKEVTKV